MKMLVNYVLTAVVGFQALATPSLSQITHYVAIETGKGRLAKLIDDKVVLDSLTFSSRANANGFIVRKEGGIHYLVDQALANPPLKSSLARILREADQKGFPAHLNGGESPSLASDLRSLFKDSILGTRTRNVERIRDADLSVHVGIAITCDHIYKGQVTQLRWSSSSEKTGRMYPTASDIEAVVSTDTVSSADQDAIRIYFSERLPGNARGSLSRRAMEIWHELEEESNKTISGIEQSILGNYMKKLAGKDGWSSRKECRADELPDSLQLWFGTAFRSKFVPESRKRDTLVQTKTDESHANAFFREGLIRNLRTRLILTTGVKNGDGHSLITVSLEALLKG